MIRRRGRGLDKGTKIGGSIRQAPSPIRERLGLRAVDESGAATIEVLMAVTAALVLTLFLVNALLMLYARSVIQHAADVGARIGARSGGSEVNCETLATQTIADLAELYTDDTDVQCSRGTLITTATVNANLDPVFTAFGPDWSFTIRATSSTEPVP